MSGPRSLPLLDRAGKARPLLERAQRITLLAVLPVLVLGLIGCESLLPSTYGVELFDGDVGSLENRGAGAYLEWQGRPLHVVQADNGARGHSPDPYAPLPGDHDHGLDLETEPRWVEHLHDALKRTPAWAVESMARIERLSETPGWAIEANSKLDRLLLSQEREIGQLRATIEEQQKSIDALVSGLGWLSTAGASGGGLGVLGLAFMLLRRRMHRGEDTPDGG